MKVTITKPKFRSVKGCLGHYVHFGTVEVQTDEPIITQVEEYTRTVIAGSPLDKAFRAQLGNACVGGDPLRVTFVQNSWNFTIEYKAGYGGVASGPVS